MKNYQSEFSNYIEIMGEALRNEDYNTYGYASELLGEAIDERKREKELMAEMDTTNFGVLNHVFEEELPRLFKENRKAVRAVIKTIKEDRNLMAQFNFYNVIKEQYSAVSGVLDSRYVLEKIAGIICNDIDLKTVNESNGRLRDVMAENGVVPSKHVDDDHMALYESGHVILTTSRTPNNMVPLMESHHNVAEWMQTHKDDKKENGKTADEMIREFEDRLRSNLNEEEISLVKAITDHNTPIAEKRKERLFNQIKGECIAKVDKILERDGDKDGLSGLRKKIDEVTFNNETIVRDVAKLLEIGAILSDEE